MTVSSFITNLPKAELHIHIEGTFEPELMLSIARRNGVTLPFATVDEARDAYRFSNLQDFLDIYYQGVAALLTERDFRRVIGYDTNHRLGAPSPRPEVPDEHPSTSF